jgi:putative heme-binding domain-containing protein
MTSLRFRSARLLGGALLALACASAPSTRSQESADETLPALVEVLAGADDAELQMDILNGLTQALKGRREVPMPAGWREAESALEKSPDPKVRQAALGLALTFGSPRAREALAATARDASQEAGTRREALDALLGARPPGLSKLLMSLLDDPQLRSAALRGLAGFDEPEAAASMLKLHPTLTAQEKRDAMNTLASRATYAIPLLLAVDSGRLERNQLTADLVRQLRNLKSGEVDLLLAKVWGAFRDSSADAKAEIERYKKLYRAGGSQPGDALRGRVVFSRTCQQCHSLYGVGGQVGPDLTGSNRADLDYILENILDPNAVIPNDYRGSSVNLKDDQVLTGIVKADSPASLTVVTANETVVIPKGEIESVTQSQISMMPEGLLTPLSEQEVRDLVYYLSRPGQVPLMATPDTLGYFFNERDLGGWDGADGLWAVEQGEIIGKTQAGLRHNEFLKSEMLLEDFRLVLEIKLTPNSENSGIQFRSEPLPDGEVKGYQADAGAGWWGKLYEERGRALLWDKPGDAHARKGEWNTYEIVAVGSRILTALNGQKCVDLDDPAGARHGYVAFQLHSGGPMEVRFRKLVLELNPKPELKTLNP